MVDFTKLRTLTPEEVAAIPPEQPDPDYIRRNTIWDGGNLAAEAMAHMLGIPLSRAQHFLQQYNVQRRRDASVTPEQAEEYVRKERERNANRDEPYPAPKAGFINDYD